MKKIGMRNIKTGIAVFLSILAGHYGLVETPVYTVSVCIISMKNTIKNSLHESASRIWGTLLGGIIGYIFATLFKGNILTTSLGVILIIHICNSVKLYNSSAIASITFIAICLGVGNNSPLNYSITRTKDTLVGVIIALVVNYLISRKTYIKHLRSSFNNTYKAFLNVICSMMETNDFSSSYIKLNTKYIHLQEIYNHLIDELSYSSQMYCINSLHLDFDLCEQLIHHVHGLHLIEKKELYTDPSLNEAIFEYHKKSILKLTCKCKSKYKNQEKK